MASSDTSIYPDSVGNLWIWILLEDYWSVLYGQSFSSFDKKGLITLQFFFAEKILSIQRIGIVVHATMKWWVPYLEHFPLSHIVEIKRM